MEWKIWDCVLNKVFKALQNKSCLPQRKNPLQIPCSDFSIYVFLSYFSASAQLNVTFLKEECLWIRVDADSLGSGVWHFPFPSADICHVTVSVEETRRGPLPPSYTVLLQICYHFPKFSFYLNVAFYSLNQIFW